MTDPYRESNHPALYYQDMLGDTRRMARYRAAIDAVVRPGDVVADLGTGLGVLAMMAVQAGAARVYAVDVRSFLLPITRRVIDANGMADRIILVDADATTVELPEPVDLIINELIGDFGTDENIYECVAHVAAHFLRPGGRVLPRRLSTHMVGGSYRDEFRGVYTAGFQGLDLSRALTDPFVPAAVMHGLRNPPLELTGAATLEAIDFEAPLPERGYEREVNLEVIGEGEMQGFVGYFACELAPGISLDNYPCYPGCHWVNWHWPVTPVQRVLPGQRIRGLLTTPERTVASCWSWAWTLD